ncbi:hypothetical protein [Pseudoduganella sp. GCM10020061]|uniref:hypothetical protein n=1 Tax=Pseudoduganella sp. GCM10020061 TaxID=3317345 RepID=UPI00363D40C9
MTMPPMQIDTQQVVEKLTGAGVPHRQARAHASVLSDALQDVDLRNWKRKLIRSTQKWTPKSMLQLRSLKLRLRFGSSLPGFFRQA